MVVLLLLVEPHKQTRKTNRRRVFINKSALRGFPSLLCAASAPCPARKILPLGTLGTFFSFLVAAVVVVVVVVVAVVVFVVVVVVVLVVVVVVVCPCCPCCSF